MAALLRAACQGIGERGKAEVGSKTMLDALVPAAAAAEDGARATTTMRAVHGRAGWLAERSVGHEDAGARLIAICLRAAADAATRVTEPNSPDVPS